MERSSQIRVKRKALGRYQLPRLDNSPSDFTTSHHNTYNSNNSNSSTKTSSCYQQSYQLEEISWTSGILQRLKLGCCANVTATDKNSNYSSISLSETQPCHTDPAKVLLLDNHSKNRSSSSSPINFTSNRTNSIGREKTPHCRQLTSIPAQLHLISFSNGNSPKDV